MTDVLLDVERRALDAARAAAWERRGDVEPNPPVGAAVIPAGGTIFAVGTHRAYGGPHAEVDALAAARAMGLSLDGATVVVTLEPCSTHGKTPPCTGALIDAGVARVVVGAVDPFPAHAGAGLTLLREAGIDIVRASGEIAGACDALLARFKAGLAASRPHVLAKWAMSADGTIAPARDTDGIRPRAVLSGRESYALVQRWRASLDALVVGVGTILDDDPRLTIRGVNALRPLRRVVLDPSLRTPLAARVVTSLHDGFDDDEEPAATWIVANAQADDAREAALTDAGARVLRIPTDASDRPWITSVLQALRLEGVARAMIEGGSVTLRRALDADVIDDIAVFLTNAKLGDDALPAIDGRSWDSLEPNAVAKQLGLCDVRLDACGDDRLLRGTRRQR